MWRHLYCKSHQFTTITKFTNFANNFGWNSSNKLITAATKFLLILMFVMTDANQPPKNGDTTFLPASTFVQDSYPSSVSAQGITLPPFSPSFATASTLMLSQSTYYHSSPPSSSHQTSTSLSTLQQTPKLSSHFTLLSSLAVLHSPSTTTTAAATATGTTIFRHPSQSRTPPTPTILTASAVAAATAASLLESSVRVASNAEENEGMLEQEESGRDMLPQPEQSSGVSIFDEAAVALPAAEAADLDAGGNDANNFTLSAIPTTTMRPLVVPTLLPDFRHRVAARPYQSKHHHEHHWGPFFEEPLNASEGAHQIGIHLGTEAYLNCRVGMLRDKTVMWVRRTSDKVSLLTVGNNTYSGDPRIGVKFQYPNNWRLHINPIQKEDAGMYMCQVSTHPPRVFATNVTVLSAAIRVVDEHGHEVHDRYYKVGSLIDLTCQVAASYLAAQPTVVPGTHPYLGDGKPTTIGPSMMRRQSQYDYYHKQIRWQKDNASLPKDGYVNLSASSQWKVSRLTIPHAERTHSGIYSCSILNTSIAVVHVQILNGETPAAVQHNNYSSLKSNIFIPIIIVLWSIATILDISC